MSNEVNQPTTENTTIKGTYYSVIASMLFALMPAYVTLLPALNGYVIVGQRIIWTSIFIAVLLLVLGQFKSALKPLMVVKNWPGLIIGALLVGIQWGIFIWAPLQGETLGVAMGYFLLPLVMVLVGRFWFKEKLKKMQWLAVAIAGLAVANSILVAGKFSWVALVIAVGYPLYFILRRKQPIATMSAFFIENLLLMPIAWWACITFADIEHPFAFAGNELLLFMGLGVLGALAMLAMLTASRRLTMTMFGLLSYLEPPLILVVAVFALGETINTNELPTYLLICLAIGLLVLDGIRKWRRPSYEQEAI